MPVIRVLPHPELAPHGAEFECAPGANLCDALLAHGVELEHACGKVGACTTCHVVVRQGGAALGAMSEDEEDMLDRAWGLEPGSRLACQAIVGDAPVRIELPRYSINHAKEHG
jgi:2Fe-2S ferredoxin